MSVITDDVVGIINRAILSFVATVNHDGTPRQAAATPPAAASAPTR